MGEAFLGYTERVAADRMVHIVFIDSSGDQHERRVVPDRIWFGSTDWYPEPGWLLEGYDVDRGAVRCFAMSQIRDFVPDNKSYVPHGRAVARTPGGVPVRL